MIERLLKNFLFFGNILICIRLFNVRSELLLTIKMLFKLKINTKLAEMHFLYGCTIGNSIQAHRYTQLYPNYPVPFAQLLTKLYQRLRHDLQFVKNVYNCGKSKTVSRYDLEYVVLNGIVPSFGTRFKLAAYVDISPGIVLQSIYLQFPCSKSIEVILYYIP